MAVTEVFNGTLGALEAGPWVEVPVSSLYMISGITGSIEVHFSIDGESAFNIANEPKIVNGAASAIGRMDRLAGFPVKYMRANNRNTLEVTGKIIVLDA